MAYLNPDQLGSLIADVVAWCKIRDIKLDANSVEVRRRQSRYAEAEQKWNEALTIAEHRGFRLGISSIKQYQHAMDLLKEIRDALGPMNRNLRSPELKPSFSLDQFGNDTLWADAVEEVVTKRRRLIDAGDEKNEFNVEGRLLFYRPSENLACGAADASSNGFFDMNNVPPWDIWLGFSEGALLSWVPNTLVDVAQMGVYVNPEECIGWVD